MDANGLYRQQSIETASPGQLISMLYHGAVARTVRAEQHIAAGHLDAANRELQRAQDIVFELKSNLDFAAGGGIARNLASLYTFCIEQLVTANATKDVAAILPARRTLADLAETWDEMLQQQSAPVAAAG